MLTLIVLVNKQPGVEESDDVYKTCLHRLVARTLLRDLRANAGIKIQKGLLTQKFNCVIIIGVL